MGPGVQARHALCVSANGDPALRKLAYRWYDAAPPAGRGVRVPPRADRRARRRPDMVLMLGDEEFAFADFRFDVSVDEDRMELDLVVAHPAFPRAGRGHARRRSGSSGSTTSSARRRSSAGSARLEWSERPPERRRRRARAARAGRPAGRDRPSGEWAVLRGEDAIVVAARPLRPVDHPYFDELCELTAARRRARRAAGPRGGADARISASAPSTPRASRASGERTAFVYVDRDESTSTELGAWASDAGLRVPLLARSRVGRRARVSLVKLPTAKRLPLDNHGQISQLCHNVCTARYVRHMTDLLQQPTGVHVDLDGRSLTIDEAVRFARGGGRAVLSPEAARRVEQTRALKQDLIAREIPIYGVTTGFGDSAHRQIAPEKAARLQQNMLRFLGAGTGQIASPEVTRATMLFRANCLAKGNSGVRLELIERLLTLLNHDILPLIPERGSCGASGDLVPLSYVGRALAGETEVLYEGEVREAADVLAELGLEPFFLEAKEGLAMTNGTSFMSGFAVAGRARRARAGLRRRPLHGDGLAGADGQPRPLQRLPVRGQAAPGDHRVGRQRADAARRARRSRTTPRRSCRSTAPASASSSAPCRTSTRSAARRTSRARCATRSSGSRSGSRSRSTRPTTTRCSTPAPAACRAAATSTAATSRRPWTR